MLLFFFLREDTLILYCRFVIKISQTSCYVIHSFIFTVDALAKEWIFFSREYVLKHTNGKMLIGVLQPKQFHSQSVFFTSHSASSLSLSFSLSVPFFLSVPFSLSASIALSFSLFALAYLALIADVLVQDFWPCICDKRRNPMALCVFNKLK